MRVAVGEIERVFCQHQGIRRSSQSRLCILWARQLPLQVRGAKKCAQLARCKAWEPRPPSTARGAAAIAEKQKRAPILIGALWLPNGHGGRSAPGGRSSEPSVAQASALRKRTARRKAANAKRAFSVQSRVGQKRKSTYFHRCSVVAQRGFEPRQTESESVVLPLHNWAISKVPYYYSRLAPKCQ